MRRVLFAFACASFLAAYWLFHMHAVLSFPRPIDEIGEDDDFEQQRSAWIERKHAHAPGTDWRAADAATRNQLNMQRAARLVAAHGGAASAMPSGAPAGVWRERGARNIAGRVSDVDYDAATDRLTVFAHGGQLWRSQRSSLNWQPLNDHRRFEASENRQNFQRLTGNVERWIAADDTQHAFFYSDDQGATWTAASGFRPPIWFDTAGVAARDLSSNQLYALVFSFDNSTGTFGDRLITSADRGASYSDMGFVGPYAMLGSPLGYSQDALFALGQGSSGVYLLAGTAFIRIEANGTPTHLSTISAATVDGFVGLTGGIDVSTGVAFFYAFFETNGSTAVFRSLDAGVTWQARGTVPSTHNIRISPGTSLHDANLVFYGGMNLYRSGDGGMSFSKVNDWDDYYSDPATKLHADLSFVKTFADGQGKEIELIGTDGGLYESRDGLLTVSNLSLDGMRQAQYYGSYTSRIPPYAISIGTQDQGYQFAVAPSSAIASYAQLTSGDFANLTSSDDGATVWMNYPYLTQISSAATTSQPVISSWFFSQTGFGGALFFAPLVADPGNPQSAWLGGGSASPGHNHVVQLVRDPDTYAVTATEGSFEFSQVITAMAISPQAPHTWYAMAFAGSGFNVNFYRSNTPLSDWALADTALLPLTGNIFFNMILPDPAHVGTVYICGSGYDTPPVYVSNDDGNSFAAMSTGLPATMVNAMAMSPDGNDLFAATEVGPFYYDRSAASWVDLGAGAADNVYSNVEYIPALHVARFSTYGRGLWDYDLGGGDLIFRDGLD